jgi:hypothetical protein
MIDPAIFLWKTRIGALCSGASSVSMVHYQADMGLRWISRYHAHSLCRYKATLMMTTSLLQYALPLDGLGEQTTNEKNRVISSSQNSIAPQDRRIHDWYRFVLSYPPHLVRDYLLDFGLSKGATILDPFCGTGTTVVEAKLCGLQAIGTEANPFPHFASSVKTNWDVDIVDPVVKTRKA